MLRDYEILYIVRPDLDEDQVQEAVGSVDKLIVNLGGATVKTDVWGRRRLAYEVRHLREGQYVLTDFRIDPARVPEMEATLKISDAVFRHLIVRKPEKKTTKTKSVEAATTEAATAEVAAAEVAVETTPTKDGQPEQSEAEEAEPEAVAATAAEGGREAETEEEEE